MTDLFSSSRAFEWAYDELCTTMLNSRPQYRGHWSFGDRGGGRSSKENRHFWSACFWHDRSRHIYLPAGTAKKYVFGTPQWALTAWKESTTTNLLPPSPHWLLKHNDTHILILILGTESETAASTTEYKVLLRLKKKNRPCNAVNRKYLLPRNREYKLHSWIPGVDFKRKVSRSVGIGAA